MDPHGQEPALASADCQMTKCHCVRKQIDVDSEEECHTQEMESFTMPIQLAYELAYEETLNDSTMPV